MRRPPGYSARSRLQKTSKARKDRLGYIILALSGAVTLGVCSLAFAGKAAIDTKTGCLVDHRPPVAHTVILIDETDQLSRDELKYAKELVLNEYHWLPMGGRLTVRNIVADPDAAEDIVVCRMDDGSASWGITGNVKMERKRFDKIAGARLDELYTALRTAQPQKSSPILEYASAVMDRSNFGANIKERRLVLLSDMAQHSDLFSQYGPGARRGLTKDAAGELGRDFAGVKVRIHYVPRRKLNGVQGKSHQRFWAGYFQKMGGEVAIGHDLLIGEDPAKETWSE